MFTRNIPPLLGITPPPNQFLSNLKDTENSSIIDLELGKLESILVTVMVRISILFPIIVFSWSNLLRNEFMILCSCHITYAFQSESTLYSCLNVKELLARSRREIWSLSDCNGTRTQNHLFHKWTLNHLAKRAS